MAVKRAKHSRSSGAAKKSAPVAKDKSAKSKVTKLSSARKKLASKGPAPAAKKKAAQSLDKAVAKSAAPKATKQPVVNVVEGALDEMKAVNVKVLAVNKLTDITDTMIIASGNSDRHVRSIADRVVEHAKKAGFRPTGVEGERDGEWVLVDLQDVIVHIMLPKVREFYRLESLWDVSAARREATEQSA
ncbi:ribosome silencing factor [Steroidobacter sp.]|uniref:ribosome silencing factor n=1 Tax=Steroidobacter sp. TaxID=1978227 RepID=UPI001A466FB4|nr:ribosome silencing factor [Steroidobacter sp.]MBL8265078.1 ribosome silencing factor [Steroidobacter sp.]